MRNIKSILLAVVLLTSAYVSQAQIAHINSEELIAAMPETKSMENQLKVLGENYDTEYKAQASALEAKAKKYQTEAATKTNTENEKRSQEIAEMQQKLQLYIRSAQEELQNKRYELIKPIVEKAQAAIEEIAAEKGIKYVLDSAAGKGLLVFKGEDLLPSVKSKLGI